jgi:hypothetical protein
MQLDAAVEESAALCASCRLTRVIPPLAVTQYRTYWYRLEQAKRRLLYTLVSLQLPLTGKAQDPEHGLAFEFLADAGSLPKVVTGHDGGVITINIAEADDAERERVRLAMGEPYRTLLGHLRHECGHYYWERLIAGSEWQRAFGRLFGEEGQDYTASLQRHYQAPAFDWEQLHVSAYASAHPWEDWAETWAHYLHMVDTLETAQACGLALIRAKRGTGVARPTGRGALVRRDARALVCLDLRPQQPQPQSRYARRLPVLTRPAGAR